MITIWKALFMIVAGVLFLRTAGRKSISQMTLAETVVMISIGSIIIQPILEQSIWRTLLACTVFVAVLILLEFLQVKFNAFETFLTGKAKVVIENGQLKVHTLRSIRMTVDQLEMRLRQQGISTFSDVKLATVEPNGQLGYQLTDDAKPLTAGEFKRLMSLYITPAFSPVQTKPDIFEEVSIAEKQKQSDIDSSFVQ